MLPTHKDDFTKKNENFMQQVRWLKFSGAALHFEEDLREEFMERFEDVDDLKVTSFRISRVKAEVPGKVVAVHYELEYYRLPSVTVRKERFPLNWELRSSGRKELDYWRIVDPFPELR